MTFISCQARRSHPKVHIRICRTCRHQTACWAYQSHVQPSLFPLSPGRPGGRLKLASLTHSPAPSGATGARATALKTPQQLSLLEAAFGVAPPGSRP